ncbi:MAG: DUF2267 domain-containing protein [Actinobacteria bacterium]|nr:MAG: DUF2267 domain-containing protein [Actinomycetota bacterium]REK35744.1 MAG: DUF2267 domain-containing protein [Actinomycetota bacterium]
MTQSTNVETLDTTIQKTNEWLSTLAELLESDESTAYEALRATISTVRDSLHRDEAAHLAAELPMLIRGLYFTGWTPAQDPIRLDKEEFLEEVRRRGGLGFESPDPAAAVLAVFHLLHEQLSEGEMDDVLGQLSGDVRDLISPALL